MTIPWFYHWIITCTYPYIKYSFYCIVCNTQGLVEQQKASEQIASKFKQGCEYNITKLTTSETLHRVLL